MSSKGIGTRLREAREQRGLGLDEVFERTKIRRRYLEALEQEQWDQLPAPVYTRGYLRTYARLLGLDADELVAAYRTIERRDEPESVPQLTDEHLEMGPLARLGTRLPSTRGTGGGPARPRHRRSRRPSLTVVAVLAVLVVGAIAIATATDDDGSPADPPEAEVDPPPGREADDRQPTETPAGRRAESEKDSGSGRIEIELVAAGDVWVCLIDRRGEALVDGEILTAGEERGPFRGRAFDAGLGNGQVEITANGELVEIAETPDPVGYRITADRARELEGDRRPTCT